MRGFAGSLLAGSHHQPALHRGTSHTACGIGGQRAQYVAPRGRGDSGTRPDRHGRHDRSGLLEPVAAVREIRRMPILIEAAVESLDDARAAIAGGAHRLELCADLDAGGTTPARSLVTDVLAEANVPVLVMIRPRPGDFVYTRTERERMRDDIGIALRLGAAGVVLGALDESGHIDVPSTQELVAAAQGRSVTFHRAIDDTPDVLGAIDSLASLGVARVLSAGAAPTAVEGADTLAAMVARAGDALRIVAGGGVRAANVATIVRRAGVHEVHARCGGDASRIRAIAEKTREWAVGSDR
jgi:copper homeostasis protein